MSGLKFNKNFGNPQLNADVQCTTAIRMKSQSNKADGGFRSNEIFLVIALPQMISIQHWLTGNERLVFAARSLQKIKCE